MFKNRKLITALMAIAMLAAVSSGIAYAYFTDYEEARGGAAVSLNGKSEITETVDDDGTKHVSIKNTGESDLIVRVQIFGDYISEVIDVKDGWKKGSDDWYYYNAILTPGSTSTELKVTVDSEKAKADRHDFDIVVVHESSRVLYDGSESNKVALPKGWELPDISVGMKEVD